MKINPKSDLKVRDSIPSETGSITPNIDSHPKIMEAEFDLYIFVLYFEVVVL